MIQGWSRWKVVKWFTKLKYLKTVWFWLILTLLEYIPLSRVSKCSSSNVITNEAYLLFFELSSWPKRWSFERLIAAVILRAFVINWILEIFSTCRILWYPPERYPQHFKFRESEKPLLQQSSKMQQHSDPKCQDKKWPCSGTYKHPGPKSFRPTNKSFVNFQPTLTIISVFGARMCVEFHYMCNRVWHIGVFLHGGKHRAMNHIERVVPGETTLWLNHIWPHVRLSPLI